MRILALETSTELGSCALWQDGKLLSRLCPLGQSHSDTLLPLVQSLLAEAGCSVQQLDAIAFGAGPGAFTGLRVACGVTQGLAIAYDLPVIPITSLAAMAWQVDAPYVLALLDARMNEVYSAAFQRQSHELLLLGEVQLAAPHNVALPEQLRFEDSYVAAGNALQAYPVLAQRLREQGMTQQQAEIMPLATAVAELAIPVWQRGEALDPALAAPFYVRDKVAQTVAERLAQGGKA